MRERQTSGRLCIFVGPPGSGKGSISYLCQQKLGFTPLSTGDLCRWHISQMTPLGQVIDLAIKSGKLVPDELITDMVGRWLEEQTAGEPRGIIFDGFPRTVAQARALSAFLIQKVSQLDPLVVRFKVADETVVRRLAGRYVCTNKKCQRVYSALPGSSFAPRGGLQCDECGGELARRPDDEETLVRERLRIYYEHEKPLVEECRQAGWPLVELDVERAPEEVFENLKRVTGFVGA